MAMAVVKESVFRCSILLLIASLMVVSAAAAAGDKSDVRGVETEQFQSLNVSSMAERAKASEALNENAVQDPEEVVSMVEM